FKMDELYLQHIKEEYEIALESKKAELITFDYEDVTIDSVFDCLVTQVWKGQVPERAHVIASDILSLKPAVYMTYMTSQAYTIENDDLLSSIEAVTKGE